MMFGLFGRAKVRQKHIKLTSELLSMTRRVVDNKRAYADTFADSYSEAITWYEFLKHVQKQATYLENNPIAVLPKHTSKQFKKTHHELSVILRIDKPKHPVFAEMYGLQGF